MSAPSSRRALLAGLAAAPFAAAPVAASLAGIEVHPDAELLTLEPEFLVRNAALDAAYAEVRRVDDLVEAHIGVYPWQGDAATLKTWSERAQTARAELGWWQAEAGVTEAHEIAMVTVRRILAIRPVTLDGLQLKARVLRTFELDPEEGILDDILAVSSAGRA